MTWIEYHCGGVNPVPWATGTLSAFRVNGAVRAKLSRNEQLERFKSAYAEEIVDQNSTRQPVRMMDGELEVEFYFWRHLEHKEKWADATNLTKGAEDALQGVLYDNDASNRVTRGHIVEQSESAGPYIVVRVRKYLSGGIYIPKPLPYSLGVRSSNDHGDGKLAF